MRTQHNTQLTTHMKTNAAVDFHGGMVPAAFGPHEAWVLFLLLLPTCCGTLEMPFYSFITQVIPFNKYLLSTYYVRGPV